MVFCYGSPNWLIQTLYQKQHMTTVQTNGPAESVFSWCDKYLAGFTMKISPYPKYPRTSIFNYNLYSSVQSLSHVQLFATLWTAAHQASLSITNSQSLLKLTSTESVIPSNHLILCHPLLLPPSIFPSIRKWCFQRSQFFTSGGQRIGVSASASVLPINIQDLFPLEWTGWISVQSKGLSRVFSNTTTQKHQFSFLYSPTLTSIHDYWRNNSFEKIDLC